LQQELERLFERVVLGPELDDGGAWLDALNLPHEERAALSAQRERLAVYRKLVRGTLREALVLAIPRTIARLGPLFDETFERFLAERAPRSHYLRDVTTELLDFAAERWRDDPRVPRWAHDLARHEALHIEIAAMPVAAGDGAAAELALDRGLRFSEASRVVRYGFAVHRLSEDENDRSDPEAAVTALFVYRSPEHEVRYLELSPVAAAILERLHAGETLGAALQHAARERGVTLDAALIEGTARLLADLAERGALLGACETAAASVGLVERDQP
jgi:hypothetical protein